MESIATKIKWLRNNKKMTQEELAEVLCVSPQAVSKWENGNSSPDIILLPQIARFFGISMDELFSYKLDSLNYKEQFLRFMVDNGALRFGTFTLQSGRRSPYYIDAQIYNSASQMAKLGQFYAKCINENNIYTDLLIGNEESDKILLLTTGIAMFEKYGMDVKYGVRTSIQSGWKKSKSVTIIADTLTTGATIDKCIEELQMQLDNCNIQVIVSLDRMEKNEAGTMTAKEYLEKKHHVKIYSIANLQDIIDASKKGIVGVESYSQLVEYQKQYGNK